MILADVMPTQDVGVWVVGIVLTAIVGALGFLVRNSFEGISKGLEGLGAKLDAMGLVIAQHDGDRRVLEARVQALERLVVEIRRECRECSEGPTR